jgi:hypothetical protein
MSTLSVNTIQPYSGTTVTIAGLTLSGSQNLTGSFTGSFTGSLLGTASYADNATSASFASNIANGLSPTFANVTASNVLITGTASVALLHTQVVSSSVIYSSGSNQFGDASDDIQTFYGTADFKTGPVRLTGSAVGNLTALSISSNTASLDCSTANLFTLQLVSGSNTFINPTNVQAGQTFNLLVSTTGSATVSFPAIVKQTNGSPYVPTTTVATDVLSFIVKDSSSLLLASIKNLV